MARGFFSGVLVGSVCSVIAAGAVSVIVGPPDAPFAGGASELEAPDLAQDVSPITDTKTDDMVPREAAPAMQRPDMADALIADTIATDIPTIPQVGTAIEQNAPEILPANGSNALPMTTETEGPNQSVQSDTTEASEEAESLLTLPDDRQATSRATALLSERSVTMREAPAQNDLATATVIVPDQTRQSTATPGAFVPPELPSFDSPSEPPARVIPFEKNAEPFDNPDQKPLLSVVLVDKGDTDGSVSVGLPALRRFPYPLTIAIDPSVRNASRVAQRYRAQGYEVMILMDGPPASKAQIAATLADAAVAVPEAVAYLDGGDNDLGQNTGMTDHVLEALSDTGHGLVLRSNQPDGPDYGAIPFGVASHDLESAGTAPTDIRRFLDKAISDAQRDGAAIVVGMLAPETISGLVLWDLLVAQDAVALAPITAVLGQSEE